MRIRFKTFNYSLDSLFNLLLDRNHMPWSFEILTLQPYKLNMNPNMLNPIWLLLDMSQKTITKDIRKMKRVNARCDRLK